MTQQFTYSGNVYSDSAAGTTTFALVSSDGNNIEYLQQSHIHVFLSTDDGVTWTEQARPADWDFDAQGTSVVLTSAIAAGEWIKVERNTPYEDRYITFQEGSLLTSDELNEGEDFSMYVDQELFDAARNIIGTKVTKVTGTAPINVDNTDELNPNISLDRITQAEAEADPTNPSWDTDDVIATPGATDRLYANLMGTADGFPGAGNLGKQGKIRIDNVSGATPELFFWDAAAQTPAWVQIATEGPQGPVGPEGPPPGLQAPPATATNVPNQIDGTVGTATANVTADANGDLLFEFGIPVGIQGEQGPRGETGSGVNYQGPINPVTDQAPADPTNGDFFVSTAAGVADASWAGLTDVGVNDRLIWNEAAGQWDRYEPADAVVNLGYTAAADGGTVTNTAGDDAALPLATQADAGLFSPVDKAKIDGIADGAEVNVQSDWSVTDSSSDAFIANKPTIPDAQVQSNWNETNSAQPSFIQNKPTIPDAPVQSNWTETDTNSLAFIQNKPTIPAEQVQSDWDNTDNTSPAFILNKPDIDLGYSASSTFGSVTNTAGDNATLPAATTSLAGLLTAADKTKLNGIATGAQTGTVTSVATSGAITGGTITTTGTITARDASVNQTGVVQLNNATDSTSTTTAATANAVRVVNDLADTANTNANTAIADAAAAATAAGNAQTAANNAQTTANTANTTANAALARAGGTMTGGVYQTIRTIGNNSTWNMQTGNLWTFAGGTIANPSNATAGMSGLIFCTGAIAGWGGNFTFAGGAALAPTANAVLPYYVTANNAIRIGNPSEGIA